jgi:CBS domain-containing protein
VYLSSKIHHPTISPDDLERAESLFVADIMGEPVSAENDCELIRALSFMHKYKIQDLPVVEWGNLVGIVSRVDIGRAFLSSWLTSNTD